MSEDTPGIVDGYRIDSLVASGGMAEIFLAEAPGGQTVAIKRMKPSCAMTRGYLEMFLDEAAIITRFDHPNLTRATDFEAGPPPYLVLEYIDGPDLRVLIWEAQKKQGGLPADLAAALISQAARGLHHAHVLTGANGEALEIVHRDLSPQNVMIARDGVAKVVDFGIARAVGRTAQTKAGVIKGKYAYMAPEQIIGGEINAVTDVFALGILLYEILCGENPFHQDRDDKTLFAVVRDAPLPLSFRDPKIPDDLWEVAKKAMQKKQANRYPSAEAFADAVDACIATRRAAVTTEHLADYLKGLWALPVPEGEEPPPPLQDSEIDLVDLEIAPTDYEMEAVQMPAFQAADEAETMEDLACKAGEESTRPDRVFNVPGATTLPDPIQQYAELHTAATTRHLPVKDRSGKQQVFIWVGGILVALVTGALLAWLTG